MHSYCVGLRRGAPLPYHMTGVPLKLQDQGSRRVPSDAGDWYRSQALCGGRLTARGGEKGGVRYYHVWWWLRQCNRVSICVPAAVPSHTHAGVAAGIRRVTLRIWGSCLLHEVEERRRWRGVQDITPHAGWLLFRPRRAIVFLRGTRADVGQVVPDGLADPIRRTNRAAGGAEAPVQPAGIRDVR